MNGHAYNIPTGRYVYKQNLPLYPLGFCLGFWDTLQRRHWLGLVLMSELPLLMLAHNNFSINFR